MAEPLSRSALRGLGTHAYTVLAGSASGHPRWSAVGLPGHAAESGDAHDENALERLHMPKAMRSEIYPLLQPGTTLLVTDAPILENTTGPTLAVLGSGLPETAPMAASPEMGDRRRPAPVDEVRIN